jgi:CRISPR-associated protein Cmr4
VSDGGDINKIFARALDPIHIGAGGYRLGRVDNTIVRDPATDVPKIPGTSLAGVIKEFYTLYLAEKDGSDQKPYEEKRKCAEESVRQIFGDVNNKGKLRFYDGQIIFFPVSSIQGTVWITTKELCKYWFGEKAAVLQKVDDKTTGDKAYVIKKSNSTGELLNLGWLLLEVEDVSNDLKLDDKVDGWVSQIVIVSEKLFSHIVNDNLEVRTSVRIDPETGTAAQRALFTYEAIPRGSVFGFEIGKEKRRTTDVSGIINAVSPYFKLLGIGGMGTRGFGRLELCAEEPSKLQSHQKGQGGQSAQGGEANAQP